MTSLPFPSEPSPSSGSGNSGEPSPAAGTSPSLDKMPPGLSGGGDQSDEVMK